MKAKSIIFFFLFSSFLANSQLFYNVIPFKTCSNSFVVLPFWINNPLNLRFVDRLEASFCVTPSKFLLKELNSAGCNVAFPLPLDFNTGISIDYLGANKFSYSNFKFSLQKTLFNKFNFATSLGSNLLSVESFGIVSNLNWNVFLEYFAFDNFQISFAYKNLFGLNNLQNQFASIGTQYDFESICLLGSSVNISLNEFTSYNFYITFKAIEKIIFDIDVQTNPQAITFSIGGIFDDFILSLFVQYNNFLMFSQTLCITIMF